MKINRSNQRVRASAAKNKTKNFIAGEPGLARTLGKVSLALWMFGIVSRGLDVPANIFDNVFSVSLFISIIIGCIGFVLSKKEGKSNSYAVIGTISSLVCILFYLLMEHVFSQL